MEGQSKPANPSEQDADAAPEPVAGNADDARVVEASSEVEESATPNTVTADDAEVNGTVTALPTAAIAAVVPEIVPMPVAPPIASIWLEKKHPLAIRWMHWINFPVLATMIWSGLLIYWGDSQISGHHAHQVYRLGIGSWTLFRFFPQWFWDWYGAAYKITVGLGYHFFFMWFFMLNGLAYVLYTLISGEWRYLVPTKNSFKEAIQVTLHDLHIRKEPLPHRKFNGAQQIAYTSVILMGFGSLVTGLAIYKPSQAHLITLSLGGYEVARWLHFWLTMGYCVFFVIHIAQVAKAGWNNFRAMVTGYEIVPASEPSYTPDR
jgi:thiosulfate reductase cytochrome b subunit